MVDLDNLENDRWIKTPTIVGIFVHFDSFQKPSSFISSAYTWVCLKWGLPPPYPQEFYGLNGRYTLGFEGYSMEKMENPRFLDGDHAPLRW